MKRQGKVWCRDCDAEDGDIVRTIQIPRGEP